MTLELRCRPASGTLALAIAAARRAGVTRVGDVTAFGVPGIRVFQATRPRSRTLSVSQGKGLTPTAALISALLEAVELWSAEHVTCEGPRLPLAALGAQEQLLWSGESDAARLTLDPDRPRHWLAGTDLLSGRPMPAPRDLVALDFARADDDCLASTNGLAAGNTRTEALVSGVAELLEHHAIAAHALASPGERRGQQIALASIADDTIRRLLRRISAAGFELRAWSLLTGEGLAAIQCTMFARPQASEDLLPVTGNGCHPHADVAFVRALLEAVQTQATLVAGAREDLTAECYAKGGPRLMELLLATRAFGDGRLDWSQVPDTRCATSEGCLDFLLGNAERLGARAVVAVDHANGVEGLHFAHVLAPGLLDDLRLEVGPATASAKPASIQGSCAARPRPPDGRKLLFAGPSTFGLAIPAGIELRPPAVCGDLAALLAAPPAAVALIDGCFKAAPTVWHREILSLIAAGTSVLGGASLGAMRAAELAGFGMLGAGEIYRAYRAGVLVRDDAVMLDHAPAALDHAPLTIALVDAEHALRWADLPEDARRAMQRIVRTTPSELRDWRTCLARYRERTGRDFPLSAAQLDCAPSLKQADAGQVIAALAAFVPATSQCQQPTAPCYQPPITSHYRAVLAKRAPALLAIPA